MKKFAKIVLALVLAVALVLPLMPVAKAVSPEVTNDPVECSLVFKQDAASKNKLGDEKIVAVDAEGEQPAGLKPMKISKPGASIEYQGLNADADNKKAIDAWLQKLANAAGVDVVAKSKTTWDEVKANKQVVYTVYFGEVAEKPADGKDAKKPGKIDGYYQFRPYFVMAKNACEYVRDHSQDDAQKMLDKLNAHANWYKINNVPDVDMVAEHINMHGYELIAKEYNDDYGYISFRFGMPFSLVDYESGKIKFQARIPEITEEALKNKDEYIKVHNGIYYVPVYVDYTMKKYDVAWKIVPNETSLEKSMGYWPGRDITERYDRLVNGNPFKATLWAIENIGKVDPCAAKVLFPMPDYRTHDKAGLWFYAPVVAPKAVKVKDSDPAKYEVTFEYIFAGTAEYERVYKNPALKAEAKPADTKVAVKPARVQSNNPGTGDVLVLSYLVSGIAAAGAYVATKHNR